MYMEERRGEVQSGFSCVKPEGKRPLERSRRRWENNIRMICKKCVGVMDYIDLAQDRDKRGLL